MNGWPIVATMDDPLRRINEPLGLPGSGRVRYGAAMALYQAGLIGPLELEVYREAAAFDRRDPALILRERGLRPVPVAADSPATALQTLFDRACDYLNALDHPGAAEVRAGLARASGPPVPPPPRKHDRAGLVVERWLAPALRAIDPATQPLAQAIAGAAPHLAWVTYDGYPRDSIGEAFPAGHAFASIMGEASPFPATDFDLGLFLIAPDVLYRDHNHAAPELYAPLTGPHGWRFGPGTALQIKPAHAPVWNPPLHPHMTKVGAVPFLCLFVWTRDVNQVAQVLPAADWPELEALRLG
jgi:hypothetical protein